MVGMLATFVEAAGVPRMTKDELKAMLDNPDLVILDVRAKKDWTDSDSKIKGAVREDPESVKSWSGKYTKDKTFVLYCA
jgi:rhodanese-related sulfurtransferase